MKPDLDDPNNHVPPVNEGDDGGGMDEVVDIPGEDLPPKRPVRGIPSKKQKTSVHVKRHAPKPKLQEDGPKSPLEPRLGLPKKAAEPIAADPSTPDVPARKAAKKTASKAARESPRKPAKAAAKMMEDDAAPTGFAQTGSGAKDSSDGALHTEGDRIVLPAAQGDKRFRVKEITAARESVDRRTPISAPRAAGGKREKSAGKAGMSRRKYTRGERKDWGSSGVRGSLRWMIYTGSGVIALVVAAVFVSRSTLGEPGEVKPSMYSQIAPEESFQEVNKDGPETFDVLTNGADEAKKIFAIYASSRSVDDFMGLVFRPEENEAAIASAWKPLGAGSGWKPGAEAVWTLFEQEDPRYAVLSGNHRDFSGFRAYFRIDGEGLKMDWKATVGHCSADFAELKNGRGDGGEIRAFLSPADFHTFSLPEGQFRSFRLVSPDGQENLWGYTKIGGEIDGRLISEFIPSQITGEVQSEIAVVLELQRGPDDSLPNQWMITRLVRLGWLDE